MAKKNKKTTAKKESVDSRYKIEKGVPIPAYLGKRSPIIQFPEDYAHLDSMDNLDSFLFNTEQDTVKFQAIRKAIEKLTNGKKKFTIKQVTATDSRIWRDDKRKTWGGNRHTNKKEA